MLLRELDVTFPHGDRRRAEIDEQRAVRAEAARAAGGGRAKLATLQPVACGERGALALAERRLARREPREPWDEASQNSGAADRGGPLPEPDRKQTRLNSSYRPSPYNVISLKKKTRH